MHLTNLVALSLWHSLQYMANTLFLLKVREFVANLFIQ